jgi:hypothetical protein
MINAYPLQWPEGFERTKQRVKSAFKCTLGQARDGVLAQIKSMGGINPVISSNIPVTNKGVLYASQKPVDGDPAIAVYFTWKNDQYVLACDRYINLWENLRAIEKSIEAIRGLERWGASDILHRAFKGFKALPENAGVSNGAWWQVLMLPQTASKEQIRQKYFQLAKMFHPDNAETGSQAMFIKVQAAYDEAMKGAE